MDRNTDSENVRFTSAIKEINRLLREIVRSEKVKPMHGGSQGRLF